jgi:hypothetical protein|tara:strand:- start:252 stop:401 length:150 start_codon:yes stop_codon:yes gene_type:complete
MLVISSEELANKLNEKYSAIEDLSDEGLFLLFLMVIYVTSYKIDGNCEE